MLASSKRWWPVPPSCMPIRLRWPSWRSRQRRNGGHPPGSRCPFGATNQRVLLHQPALSPVCFRRSLSVDGGQCSAGVRFPVLGALRSAAGSGNRLSPFNASLMRTSSYSVRSSGDSRERRRQHTRCRGPSVGVLHLRLSVGLCSGIRHECGLAVVVAMRPSDCHPDGQAADSLREAFQWRSYNPTALQERLPGVFYRLAYAAICGEIPGDNGRSGAARSGIACFRFAVTCQ